MNTLNDVEILLVEDNPLDAEMTMRTLRRYNFINKLHWVKDGVEALNFIRCAGPYEGRNPKEQVKLMLLDLKLPHLSGIDVLRALKADTRTRAIPVIVMSSSHQEHDVLESCRLGISGYVTKPVQFSSFAEVVTKAGLERLIVEREPAR
jgi:CheY-like chemotaxis protein